MQSKMEAVVIDVYDQDGEKLNSMLMTADWHEVLKKMLEIIEEDGLPVVRRAGHVRFEADGSLSVEEDKTGMTQAPVRIGASCEPVPLKQEMKFRPYKPFEWAAGCLPTTAEPILMKMEMKVDQQTLACEGFGTDVLKAQERFLRAIMPEFDGE
jgi:hypothetical protein